LFSRTWTQDPVSKSERFSAKSLKTSGIKISLQSNLKVVNYLYVTLILATRKYNLFRKSDNNPLYINAKSNHPPSVIRQIPASINTRISICPANQTYSKNLHNYTMLPLSPPVTMKTFSTWEMKTRKSITAETDQGI